MCGDRSGGAIIVWSDKRSGNYDIYAQRVDEYGWTQWDFNGIIISNNTNDELYPQIISDGFGGAIIVWQISISGTPDIYAQRIASNGTKLWGTSGVVVCNSPISQDFPKLCSDGEGGAIFTWEDSRISTSQTDIYAQKINGTGSPMWTGNGTIICNASWGGKHERPEICSDGSGGAIITWKDNRTAGSTSQNYNIYAQKINSSGLTEWTPNGTVICNANNEQSDMKITTDGAGGAIITWRDYRTASNYTVYAQRVDSTGTTQWTNNGTLITPFDIYYTAPYICSDGTGGAIITWRDYRYTTDGDYNQFPKGIIGDGKGGAVIVWDDRRTGNWSNYDIYAQQVNSSGAIKWDPNGTAICNEGSYQDNPNVLITTTGVALFVWADNRSYVTNNWDIYIYGKNLIIDQELGPTPIDMIPVLAAIGVSMGSQPGILDLFLDFFLSPMVLGGIAIVEFIVILIFASVKKK